MTTFTVVGVYTDNDQPFVGHIFAENPHMAAAAAHHDAESQLHVIAVFVGKHYTLYEEEHLG